MRSGSSFFRRPAVLLALALGVVAALVSLLGSLSGPRSAGHTVWLTGAGGSEAWPSFSPDGMRLVYSARRGKEEGFHIFIQTLPNGQRWQATADAGNDVGPVWSPDGSRIAFLRVDGERAECMTIPQEGGPARKLADCAAVGEIEHALPAVAWMPDGASLLIAAAGGKEPPSIALIPAEGGAPQRLTTPPEGTSGDSNPAVSPDGKTVAFVRNTSADGVDGADIYACGISGGKAERLTFDDRPVRGIAWTLDGGHVVYSGFRAGNWNLWRLPAAGGSPRNLMVSGRSPQFPAIAPRGGRLAYEESPSVAAVWRARMGGEEDLAEGAPLIRSSGRESAPSYSEDGGRIVDISDQTGADEVWVSDSEGGNRMQITHLKGQRQPARPRWSPDGRLILLELRGGASEIATVPASGGEPRRVIPDATGGSWSRDGRSIYYLARVGHIWKAAADGSQARQLTEDPGMGQPVESADGKYVYYRKWRGVCRMPADGGKEEEAVQPESSTFWGAMQAAPRGWYYVEGMRGPRTQAIFFYDTGTKKRSVVFRGVGDLTAFSVSPDGKYVLYPRVDSSETSLMLVEGFQ
jgi:Tol biopolymer transport system component